MPPPWISIISLCVGLDKVMHNENIAFMGIQQLYIKRPISKWTKNLDMNLQLSSHYPNVYLEFYI